MDNINLFDYVAIFYEVDTAGTGRIKWVRADQPHPPYAMYAARGDAVCLRRYYGRLVEKHEQYRFDIPLQIIAAYCVLVDAAISSTAPFVLIGTDDDENQLKIIKTDKYEDGAMLTPLFREPAARTLVVVCDFDLDAYCQLSLFLDEVDAVIWSGEP